MTSHAGVFTGIAVLLIAIAGIALVLSKSFFPTPETAIAPPADIAAAAAALASSTPTGAKPARVQIPTLGIDAAVQQLGIIAGNRMQAPTNYTDVGWYKYGAVPGLPGTAVMYGHLDNGLGLTGVFKDLDKLAPGDEVDVTAEDGSKLRFAVTASGTYPYLSVPPALLGPGASDGKSHITFITCAGKGIRDPNMGFTYDHRLIVTATYIGES